MMPLCMTSSLSYIRASLTHFQLIIEKVSLKQEITVVLTDSKLAFLPKTLLKLPVCFYKFRDSLTSACGLLEMGVLYHLQIWTLYFHLKSASSDQCQQPLKVHSNILELAKGSSVFYSSFFKKNCDSIDSRQNSNFLFKSILFEVQIA